MFAFAKKQRALLEIERRRNQEQTYLEALPKNAPDLKDFLSEFYRNILFKRQAEMKEELLKYPDSTGRWYKQLVPEVIAYEDFWQRYYYRTGSVDRVITQLEAQDAQIRKARTESLRESWNSAATNMSNALHTATQNLASAAGEAPGSPQSSSKGKRKPDVLTSSPTRVDLPRRKENLETEARPVDTEASAATVVREATRDSTNEHKRMKQQSDRPDEHSTLSPVPKLEEAKQAVPKYSESSQEPLTIKTVPVDPPSPSISKARKVVVGVSPENVEDNLVSSGEGETTDSSVAGDTVGSDRNAAETISPEPGTSGAPSNPPEIAALPTAHEKNTKKLEAQLSATEKQEEDESSKKETISRLVSETIELGPVVKKPSSTSSLKSKPKRCAVAVAPKKEKSERTTTQTELTKSSDQPIIAKQATPERNKKGKVDLMAQAEIDTGTKTPSKAVGALKPKRAFVKATSKKETMQPAPKGQIDLVMQAEFEAGTKKQAVGAPKPKRAFVVATPKKETTQPAPKGQTDLLAQAEIEAGTSKEKPSVSTSNVKEPKRCVVKVATEKDSRKSSPKDKIDLLMQAEIDAGLKPAPSSTEKEEEMPVAPVPDPVPEKKKSNIDWKALRAKRNGRRRSTESEAVGSTNDKLENTATSSLKKTANANEATGVVSVATKALRDRSDAVTSQTFVPKVASSTAEESKKESDVVSSERFSLTTEKTAVVEKTEAKQSSGGSLFSIFKSGSEETRNGPPIASSDNVDAASVDVAVSDIASVEGGDVTANEAPKESPRNLFRSFFKGADEKKTEDNEAENKDRTDVVIAETSSREPTPNAQNAHEIQEAPTKMSQKSLFGSVFSSSTHTSKQSGMQTTTSSATPIIDSRESTPIKSNTSDVSRKQEIPKSGKSWSGFLSFRKKPKQIDPRSTEQTEESSHNSEHEKALKPVQEPEEAPSSRRGLWRRKQKTTDNQTKNPKEYPVETNAKQSVASMIEKFDKKPHSTPAASKSKRAVYSVLLMLGIFAFLFIACIPFLFPSFSRSVMDGLCAPIPPLTTFSEALDREAPWWAFASSKSDCFNFVCGESRPRTIMKLEPQNDDIFKLTVAPVESPKRALLKKRIRKAQNYGSTINVWNDDEHYDSIFSPWAALT